MSSRKKLKCCYLVSALMLAVFSATFLVMPISNKVSLQYGRIVLVLTGAVFWISCIVGYVFLFLSYRLDKKYFIWERDERKVYTFANIPTMAADISCLIGIIIMAVLAVQGLTGLYITYIDLFVIVLSLNVHLLSKNNLYKRINVESGGNQIS